MKHDINSGYKRWLLGKAIDKANIGKIISGAEEIEKLTEELNNYCDSIISDYTNEPFHKFERTLYEKADKLIKSIITRKNILTYSQILPN